jgi:hypothetical protein
LNFKERMNPMKPTTRLANIKAIADWYGIAKMFPQKHPQALSDISKYAADYGAPPDSSDTAPWMYQQNPQTTTPANWQEPLTVRVGQYYDPRTGQIAAYGSDPANDLDPTSPAFTEPPQID